MNPILLAPEPSTFWLIAAGLDVLVSLVVLVIAALTFGPDVLAWCRSLFSVATTDEYEAHERARLDESRLS